MQIKAAKHKLRYAEFPTNYACRIGQSKVSGTVRGTLGAGFKIIGLLVGTTSTKSVESMSRRLSWAVSAGAVMLGLGLFWIAADPMVIEVWSFSCSQQQVHGSYLFANVSHENTLPSFSSQRAFCESSLWSEPFTHMMDSVISLTALHYSGTQPSRHCLHRAADRVQDAMADLH